MAVGILLIANRESTFAASKQTHGFLLSLNKVMDSHFPSAKACDVDGDHSSNTSFVMLWINPHQNQSTLQVVQALLSSCL